MEALFGVIVGTLCVCIAGFYVVGAGWFLRNSHLLTTPYEIALSEPGLVRLAECSKRLKQHGLTLECDLDNQRIVIQGLIPELRLSSESFAASVGKTVQGADIEVGQDSFDAAALVRGPMAELEIRSRLNDALRLSLWRLFTRMYHIEAQMAEGELSAIFTYYENEERFFDELDTLSSIAIGFASDCDGTKEERLLGIMRDDSEPMPVRARLLYTLLQKTEDHSVDLDALLPELIQGSAETASSPVTEGEACAALSHDSNLVPLAAAAWLRDHGSSTDAIGSLSELLNRSDSTDISAVAGEALAQIRAKLGEGAGSLAIADAGEAGALSVVDEEGQLSLAEAEVEERRKKQGPGVREKG